MKKTALLFITAILFLSMASACICRAAVGKETYVFSVRGADSLRLDKYDDPAVAGEKPCVIFVFGGGFAAGTRDNQAYIPFFEWLVSEGYVVASIDYRLGLKYIGQQKDLSQPVFMQTFVNSIRMAVEDLFDATVFLYNNADAFGVDRNRIVICGSSAGAITVLMGEYAMNTGIDSDILKVLPRGFRYAGVISMAGAILSGGELQWTSEPAPMLLLHGDADSNVPYDKITQDGAGFYGSAYIAQKLHENNSPYWFVSFRNAAHEVSIRPISENREEILSFLDKFVHNRQKLMIDSEVEKIGAPELKKEFGIMDYVKKNLGL